MATMTATIDSLRAEWRAADQLREKAAAAWWVAAQRVKELENIVGPRDDQPSVDAEDRQRAQFDLDPAKRQRDQLALDLSAAKKREAAALAALREAERAQVNGTPTPSHHRTREAAAVGTAPGR